MVNLDLRLMLYLLVPVITSKSLVTATMSGTLLDGNMSRVSSSSTRTDGGISSLWNVPATCSAPCRLKYLYLCLAAFRRWKLIMNSCTLGEQVLGMLSLMSASAICSQETTIVLYNDLQQITHSQDQNSV